MSVQVTFVGRLLPIKDSEKFKGFEERKFDSGWINKTYRLNLLSGDNRFMLQMKDGCFEDMHNDVYVFSKNSKDKNGNVVKGSSFKIPFKERLTSKRLPEVAEFKKYVIDLEVDKDKRRKMDFALRDCEEGKDVNFADFGVKNKAELKAAYDKSLKKRKEFICLWDFIDCLKKLIESGKLDGKKFYIKGEQDYQYDETKDRWYVNYVPQKMYLQSDDAEEYATASVKLLFDENSLIDKEDEGETLVCGYHMVYDSSRKDNVPAPYYVTLKFPEGYDFEKEASEKTKEDKKFEIQRKRFVVDEDAKEKCQVYELGVEVKLLDGAQKREISEDDLTEEQLDALFCGDITMEEIVRELGGNVYGERETKNVFLKLMQGYSKGRQETAYESEDLDIHKVAVEDAEDNVFDESSDDDDLFADDDDLFN